MHRISFALKRAHQGSLRITRPWFAEYGLTPARFDMLYAVHHRSTRACVQWELRYLLGVSGATISRMLASLEDLGLVLRYRGAGDRRVNTVWLTDKGFRLLRDAIDETLPRRAPLFIDSAFVIPWMKGREQVSADLDHLDAVLARARLQFRDTANLAFDWIPPH